METGQFKRPRNSEAGSVLVLTAVALPVLIAFAALSLDVGYLYDYRQQMSAAADAAAISGAFEVKRNPGVSQDSLETRARNDAMRNGFSHGTKNISVEVTRGDFADDIFTPGSAGTDKYVKVVISRPVPTFLLGIVNRRTMTVNASAVAGPGDAGSGCVYALNTNDSSYPTEFNISASGVAINTPKCAVISNGNFTVNSGSSIAASEVDVTAPSGLVTGSVTPAPSYNSPQADDPFSDMDQAALFGTFWTCGWTGTKIKAGVTTPISGTANFINGTPTSQDTTARYVLNPGVYCGDNSTDAITATLTNAPAYSVTFNPGLYIVNGGGVNWKHNIVRGTGVTFYFTASPGHRYVACGQKVFDSDPPDTFGLSAPTSGAYEGLLFIQDRRQGTVYGNPAADCSSNPIKVLIKPSDMAINGVIYFPNHHIDYGATTTSAGAYTILIGGTLGFIDKAVLNSDFTSLSHGSPVKRTGIAQ